MLDHEISFEPHLLYLREGQILLISELKNTPHAPVHPFYLHARPRLSPALRLLQLLSYTSDVLIAGASFSTGPPDRMMDGQVSSPPSTTTATAIPSSHHRHLHNQSDSTTSFIGSSSSTYLHVVDRLRTLRTWLLHAGGATAVAAYSLPAAVPRVPKNSIPSSKVRNAAQQPQQESTPGGGNEAVSSPVVGPETSWPQSAGSVLSPSSGGGGGGRQEQKRGVPPSESQAVVAGGHENDEAEEEEEEEEVVDARRLPAGALIAAVLPSRLQGPNGSAGPGILVTAGVTLSGVSFLPAERECGENHRSLLWTSNAEEGGFDDGSGAGSGREDGSDEPMPPQVLGMRAIMPSSGTQQALALVWAERPSFQVLDVSRGVRAGVVEEVLLSRRHR